MATGRGRIPQQELDIRQIIQEACVRWLKPLEVCEILRNYQSYGFKLNPVPPNLPQSGALFLFDRKTLRYFRKDGHNWRKKKDGKTVREAHERLKSGSVDVLHCYYAHGEEDPNFQRRSYWMLEGAYEHIVLVHYLQVQQGRASTFRVVEHPDAGQQSHAMSPSVSSEPDDVDSSDDVEQIEPPPPLNVVPMPEPTTNPQPSLFHQLSSKDWSALLSETQPGPSFQQPQPGQSGGFLPDDIDLNDLLNSPDKFLGPKGLTPAVSLDTSGWNEALRDYRENPTNGPIKQEESWQETLEQCTTPATRDALLGQATPMKLEDPSPRTILEVLSPRGLGRQPQSPLEAQLRAATTENALRTAQNYSPTKQRWGRTSPQNVLIDMGRASQQASAYQNSWSSISQQQQQQQQQQHQQQQQPQPWQTEQYAIDTFIKDAKPVKQEESPPDNLKKLDSFGRWVIAEMGDDSPGALLASAPADSGSFWAPADDDNDGEATSDLSAQMQLDVSVSIAQVQRFSITDFSPDWAPPAEETKVLVSGRFMPTVSNPLDVKWCCMFGDVEVPAELVDIAVLRCKVPPLAPGRIPFYITCSDRLACSEVREFEIRDPRLVRSSPKQSGQFDREALLQLRFAKLLLAPGPTEASKWKQMEDAVRSRSTTGACVNQKLLELYFERDLEAWLATQTGNASVLDDQGHGLLHMASALGYSWAIKPILDAGVVPNFRDARGWTALHWAAAFGREETVVALASAGTNPSLVTDPTAKHPNGQLPSDLASAAGHKGIAGYLAERALTDHLSSLSIADTSLNEINSMSATLAGENAVEDMRRQGDEEQQSLRRSLSAVRNATKTAALIHSAYRLDSFRKRNAGEEDDVDPHGLGMRPTEIHAMAQTMQRGRGHRESSAALQIQRKFRGWKGRKDFLALRKHVVKIQAHVRGHQVRKQFKKIISVVSVIEKAVLRWRRKRVGLRGFRSQAEDNRSDDEDFLKQGRKQKELVLDKAVARVQSMARSEQGRDQYRRMLEGSPPLTQDAASWNDQGMTLLD